jgi:hypothetical protein
MTEADSVHSTPRRFTPKIVGGTDHLPDDRSRKQSAHAQVDARRPPTGSLSTTGENGRRNRQRIAAHARRLRRRLASMPGGPISE